MSPDIPISDDDVVQIQGGEQFRTRAVRKAYKIFIDGTESILESEEMTGEQIKRLAESHKTTSCFRSARVNPTS